MISVIVTSRIEGNINHNLNELIHSLEEHSRRPEDIELLVKFDDDDNAAGDVVAALIEKELPFEIRVAVGPRLKGYTSIHHGYNQLLPMISNESKIVIAMADDFRAERDWDNAMRNAAEDAGDYFIIHQRPHPVLRPEFLRIKDYPELWRRFNMDNNMFDGENLYIIDESPAWSTELLKACVLVQGSTGIDFVFPVSFTDAWTLCLEYSLWVNYGLNITKFLEHPFISRKTCEVDQPGNARWHTDRKENFDYIKSEEFISFVTDQAKEIACRLSLSQRKQ